MGFPGDLMTPVFAVARIAGWGAHIIEEAFAEAQENLLCTGPKRNM